MSRHQTRMPRLPLLAACAAALLLAAACTGDDDAPTPSPTSAPSPAATLTATAAATASPSPTVTAVAVTPTPTPTPSPTPTPPAQTASPAPPGPTPDTRQVLTTVWLIDVAAGVTHTLHEDDEFALGRIGVEFLPSDEGVRILRENVEIRFTLDGIERSRQSREPQPPRCRDLGGDAPASEIGGRRFEVNCGPFSPDGQWMTYTVVSGEFEAAPGYRVPVWDQWVVDVTTGERTLLQEGLRHCGGCDGRFGPLWSPSGRYLVYAEFYSGDTGSRVFLSDVRTGETRLIAGEAGGNANESTQAPEWSPRGDVLARPLREGGTVIEDLSSGRVLELPDLPWPARFDTTGRYVYSPPWSSGWPSTTTIVSVQDGAMVASLSGAPGWEFFYAERKPVTATDAGPAALLESADGCAAGTMIYHPGAPGGAICASGGRGAVFSPPLELVAFARVTGATGHVQGPGFGSISEKVWEIAVMDVRTGQERVLATGAVSDFPPLMRWNAQGTHLLVLWPYWSGV